LNRNKLTSYLLVAPAVLFLAVFLVYPMCHTAFLSLWNYSYFRPSMTFVGLENYGKLFSQIAFQNSLSFTLRFTLVCITLEMLIGLGLALLLRRVLRGGTVLRTISIFPYMIAPIATGQMWRLLLNLDYGIVNLSLGLFLIPPVNWLASNTGAFWATVIAQIWKSTPFVMLILLAGLQSISEDYYEAAIVDGASSFRAFWYITLPLLIPSITLALVFETIFKLRVFDLVITLTGGGPGKATTPLGVMLQQNYFKTYEAGFASAISVVLILLGSFFSWLYILLIQRRSKEGV